MALPGIWAELGIPPTSDPAAIRRAYAARLKATRPDADPQGFARLRDAYERAMQQCGTPPPPPEHQRADTATPDPAPPPPPVPAEVAEVTDRLRQDDVQGAAASLLAARAAGVLNLRQDMALADQLGWALATNRSLGFPAVRDAARQMGWLNGTPASPWAAALAARLDGGQWLADLRIQAGARWPKSWHARSVAARMLLGRGRVRTLPSMGADPMLRRRYGEFLLHAGVVGEQFDATRVESVGNLIAGRPGPVRSLLKRWSNLVFRAIGLFFLATMLGGIAGGILGGMLESAYPAMRGGGTSLIVLVCYGVALAAGAVRWWRAR